MEESSSESTSGLLETASDNQSVLVFCKFRLAALDNEWVKVIWDSDFIELDPLPLGFEAVHEGTQWCALLKEAGKTCRDSARCDDRTLPDNVQNDSHNQTEFWVTLMDNGINIKSVVALCFYFLEKGQRANASIIEIEIGFAAASLYYSLLLVPGSNAFHMFHPVPFQKSVDVIRITARVSGSKKRKRSDSNTKGSGFSQPCSKRAKSRAGRTASSEREGKKSKNVKRHRNENDYDDDEDFDGDNFSDDEDDHELTAGEVRALINELHAVLTDLMQVLKHYSLRTCKQSRYHTVQRLSDLTRLDPENAPVSFGTSWNQSSRLTSPNLSSLTLLGFNGLSLLCRSLHGDVSELILLIMKNLMCNILMSSDCGGTTTSAQSVPRSLQLLKDHSIKFVIYLLQSVGATAVLGVYRLIQHLCVSVADKAEYRTRVSQAVVTIMSHLPADSCSKFASWLCRLVRACKVGSRVFGIEVISTILLERENTEADEDQKLSENLLRAVVRCCSDKASSVRAKAISTLATCVASSDAKLHDIVVNLFSPTAVSDVKKSSKPPRPTPVVEDEDSDYEPQEAVRGGCNDEPNDNQEIAAEEMMELLIQKTDDEKVNVRKAALQLVENVLKSNHLHVSTKNVAVLECHCRDPALSIRKQMAQSITSLLETYPDDELLQRVWIEGVLPLVRDRENTMQEKCIEVSESLLLQEIVPYSRSVSKQHKLAWKLISLITESEQDSGRYFCRICHCWATNGKIKSYFFNCLKTHVGTENDAACWFLLSKLSTSFKVKDPTFAVDCWQNRSSTSPKTLQRILDVIRHSAVNISTDKLHDILDELHRLLREFNSPLPLISVMFATLNKLWRFVIKDQDKANKKLDSIAADLLKMSAAYLADIAPNSSNYQEKEDEIVCYLFTLGEVAQLHPKSTPKRVFLTIQSMVATPITSESAKDTFDRLSQPSTISSQQPSSQPLSQFSTSAMPSKIRAHAFATLGKLCLQHENLAKKLVPALARELEICPDAKIRNNIVIIMADLCKRYTGLVDRFVSNIASCLKDPSLLVRHHTLVVLTHLLQEDYIKWKGALFFRFMNALVDENKNMKTLAEYSLLQILLLRNPHMFFHHFVECIFHFNGYMDHSAYNKFTQTEKELRLFSLKGPGSNREKRFQLYKFMLENMGDEHRFKVTQKIVQDILGGVVDEILPLDANSQALLQDGLAVLVMDEIKLSTLRSSPQDDLDEGDVAAAVVTTAKKTIISQVVKRDVIENIVPVIIGLKHLLEQKKSPILKDVMVFLKEMMKDYKNEIKDILAADKQLASEIAYDLQRFEQQQQEQERRERNRTFVASVCQSPGPSTPSRARVPPTPAPNLSNPLANAILNSAQQALRLMNELSSSKLEPRNARQNRTPVVNLQRLQLPEANHLPSPRPTDSDDSKTGGSKIRTSGYSVVNLESERLFDVNRDTSVGPSDVNYSEVKAPSNQTPMVCLEHVLLPEANRITPDRCTEQNDSKVLTWKSNSSESSIVCSDQLVHPNGNSEARNRPVGRCEPQPNPNRTVTMPVAQLECPYSNTGAATQVPSSVEEVLLCTTKVEPASPPREEMVLPNEPNFDPGLPFTPRRLPQREINIRAISTPGVHISDITFHLAPDVGVLSPIAAPGRHRLPIEESSILIQLRSPTAPTPRMWRIRNPFTPQPPHKKDDKT